jgi:hypothetical protein
MRRMLYLIICSASRQYQEWGSLQPSIAPRSKGSAPPASSRPWQSVFNQLLCHRQRGPRRTLPTEQVVSLQCAIIHTYFPLIYFLFWDSTEKGILLQTISQGRASPSVFKGLNRIEVIHLVSFFGLSNIYATACLPWPT